MEMELLEHLEKKFKDEQRDRAPLLGGKAGIVQPGKEKLWDDPIVVFQDLKGVCKKCGERQFTRAWSGRIRGNGFKLTKSRFRLDIRMKFCPVKEFWAALMDFMAMTISNAMVFIEVLLTLGNQMYLLVFSSLIANQATLKDYELDIVISVVFVSSSVRVNVKTIPLTSKRAERMQEKSEEKNYEHL
ncbi:hypothetical protein HGM15179_004917 [Zosterops borbonicus]|uniref:Uncharacterized protein n=1 Tax=Zosterops borbonicus TaxID=364589 RepID=A0A8K1GQS9_9PASS|nr:hypothetical protein HGM15179_004917 [Zosterops borbonicus]